MRQDRETSEESGALSAHLSKDSEEKRWRCPHGCVIWSKSPGLTLIPVNQPNGELAKSLVVQLLHI